MTQRTELPFDCSVEEAVMMGRIPHQKAWGRETIVDQERVAASLDKVEIGDLADQRLETLSGGELQRVWLARALAQEPEFLFLDEPTNHLDIHHQLELMNTVRELGCTTLIVMHDLNLAAQFCDRIFLMNKGRIVAGGPAEDVLTPERLSSIYNVRVLVDRHPITDRLRISYWSQNSFNNM